MEKEERKVLGLNAANPCKQTDKDHNASLLLPSPALGILQIEFLDGLFPCPSPRLPLVLSQLAVKALGSREGAHPKFVYL